MQLSGGTCLMKIRNRWHVHCKDTYSSCVKWMSLAEESPGTWRRAIRPKRTAVPRFIGQSCSRLKTYQPLRIPPVPSLTFTLNVDNAMKFGTGTALFGQDVAASVAVAINNGMTRLDGTQVYRNSVTRRRNDSVQDTALRALHRHEAEGGGTIITPSSR